MGPSTIHFVFLPLRLLTIFWLIVNSLGMLGRRFSKEFKLHFLNSALSKKCTLPGIIDVQLKSMPVSIRAGIWSWNIRSGRYGWPGTIVFSTTDTFNLKLLQQKLLRGLPNPSVARLPHCHPLFGQGHDLLLKKCCLNLACFLHGGFEKVYMNLIWIGRIHLQLLFFLWCF